MSSTEMQDVTGRIGGNSLILLVSYGFNTILSGVVAVFLVRYLGREEYGLLSAAYAYVSFFTLFTSVGLDTVVQREVARRPDEAGEIVEGVLGLRLLLSGAAMVMSWCLVFFVGRPSRLTVLVVLLSFSFLSSWQSLFLMRHIVTLRMGEPKLLLGAWAVAFSLGKLALIGAAAPLEAFAGLEVVAGVGSLLVCWRLGTRVGISLRFRYRPRTWRAFLAESWLVALTQTLIQVYLRLDQLMLLRMVGPEEVGLYGASTRLVEFANVIPVVFLGSIFPLLSRLSSESDGRFRTVTELSVRAMMWLSLPLALVLSQFSAPLVELLFGGEFLRSSPIQAILAWSVPFVFLNSVLFNRLFASGDQRSAAVLALGGAGVNVALNLALIPLYAGRGAALASVVSYGSVTLLAIGPKASRPMGLFILRALSRQVLAAGAAGFCVWSLQPQWVLGSLLVPGLFLVVLVLLGEIGGPEMRWLFRAVGRR